MGLETTTRRAEATGDGTQSVYAYGFYIQSDDYIKVYVTNTSGVQTLLTKTTDYTISGVGNTSGGNVTLVDASQTWLDGDGDLLTGYKITLLGVDPLTQVANIKNQSSFKQEIHESQFDKQTRIDQQQQDEIDRSIKLPKSISGVSFNAEIPESAIVANTVPIINSAADGMTLGPTASEISGAGASATAAAASASAASTSETNAGTSETNAAASATAAAASAATAAAVVASAVFSDVQFLDDTDSPITVDDNDKGSILNIDTSSGNVVINLEEIANLDLSAGGYVVVVKKTDSSGNTITINRGGTDTIDGQTSYVIGGQDAGVHLVADVDGTPDDWTTLPFGLVTSTRGYALVTGDDATTSVVLGDEPGSINNISVYLDGILQIQTTDYTLSGATVSFVDGGSPFAVPSGSIMEVYYGAVTNIGVPSDASVTLAKMTANSVDSDQYVDGSIDREHLSVGSVAGINIAAKTANYTVTTSDDLLLGDSSGGAFTFTMPTEASATNRVFTFKKTTTDFTAIDIDDDAGSLITTLNTEGETVEIVTDGTSWYIKNRYIPSIPTAYTPTGGWTTNTTYTGSWTRYGNRIKCEINIALGGAPNSASLTAVIPSGLTFDTTALVTPSSNGPHLGRSIAKDSSPSNRYDLTVLYSASNQVYLQHEGNADVCSTVSETVPITFASGDTVKISIEAPISGWNG